MYLDKYTFDIEVDTNIRESGNFAASYLERALVLAPNFVENFKHEQLKVRMKLGTNTFVPHDCAHCKYQNDKDKCNGDRQLYPCAIGLYQTNAVIGIKDCYEHMETEVEKLVKFIEDNLGMKVISTRKHLQEFDD